MLKSLLFSFFVVFLASECPNGADYKSDLGYCIFPYDTEVDYATAVKACQRVNGNLISLHNLFQNTLLSAYIDEYLSTQSTWLGVQSDQFQVWSWNDASQWDYEKWAKQEPFDGNHCAMLSVKDQNWHSMDCAEDRAAFLCAISANPTTQNSITSTTLSPKQCPPNWSYFEKTNACYYIGANMTWTDAESYCRTQKSHLASVHSEEENHFIYSLKYTKNCDVVANDWISITLLGSYRDYHDQTWLWSDGTAYDYTPDLCNDEFGRHFMIDNTKCSMCANGTWFSPLMDYDNSIYPFFACKLQL